MNRIITIFEDRLTKIDINDDEQKSILRMREIIGESNFKIYSDGFIQVMHYVGFVSFGEVSIQVLPKVIDDVINISKTEAITWSMKALYNMLRVSEFNRVLELPDSQSLNLGEHNLLDIFIHLFAKKVLNIFERNIYREYKLEQDNTSFIKGKINVSDSIKLNIKGSLIHNVNYDELTENNIFNSIIKTVLYKLLSMTQNRENKKLIKMCLSYFDNIELIELSNSIFDSLKFSRLNEKLRLLINMAKMFYSNLAPEYQIGKQTVLSFLIPVNELFEYYVYKKLLNNQTQDVQYQKKINFIKYDHITKMIKPDFILIDQLNNKSVGDAKYKIIDPYIKKDLSYSDLYQIYTYIHLINCTTGYLYYPQTMGNEMKDFIIESFEDNPVKIIVKFIDLINE